MFLRHRNEVGQEEKNSVAGLHGRPCRFQRLLRTKGLHTYTCPAQSWIHVRPIETHCVGFLNISRHIMGIKHVFLDLEISSLRQVYKHRLSRSESSFLIVSFSYGKSKITTASIMFCAPSISQKRYQTIYVSCSASKNHVQLQSWLGPTSQSFNLQWNVLVSPSSQNQGSHLV